MTSALIRDGYNEDAYIKEVPGLYPAVRLKYRPMLVIDRDTLATNCDASKVDDKAANVLCARAMEACISQWDICDGGKPVEITAANLLRLKPALYGELLKLIRGQRGTDPDPDAAPKTSPEDAIQQADAVTAAINGQRPEDLLEAAEAADVKNSTAG